MKSRLSLHICSTESGEVPQLWIPNFSTKIPVLHNESIGLTSAGSPWRQLDGYIEWKKH